MDIDSPPESIPLKPRDRILQRLALLGIPEEVLGQLQPGLVSFVKVNKSWIPQLVSTILPTSEEVEEVLSDAKSGSIKLSGHPTMKSHFRESMVWLKWLMFDDAPATALLELAQMSVERGVCGAVWANNDIAYKCQTCEHDPTCAICAPCFQNGNHEGHDYCTIYSSGGCCDCGDVTAWKREGFCSKHKGTEQIQPLPAKYANSVEPVLDTLFVCWKKKLLLAETVCKENPRASGRVAAERKKFAIELTFVVVEMLLEFCKDSESLLCFISRKILSSVGLLEILMRAERFLSDVKKLHELLLKLIGEPVFKHEFSKVYLNYYPTVVSEIIKKNGDNVLKKYPLLPMFSVQIFTVPTLTPSLVTELNLLDMLLGCLGNIFISCAGEDGSLQAAKLGGLYVITTRVLHDILFSISQTEVPKYIIRDRQDILRTWMSLLTSLQGMNPLKRKTGLQIEEESDNMSFPFDLGRVIANIHSHMVDGAFAVTDDWILSRTYEQEMDDGDGIRHSKVGRLSQESSACSAAGRNNSLTCPTIFGEDASATVLHPLIPPSVTWLAYECLRAIENWLGVGNTSWTPNELSQGTSNNSGSNVSVLKRTLSKSRIGKKIFCELASSSEDHGKEWSAGVSNGSNMSAHMHKGNNKLAIGGSDFVTGCNRPGVDDSATDLDALRALSSSHWPNIVYDVSSQEISVHFPLHQLLSLLLHKALRRCFGDGELALLDNMRDSVGYSLSTNYTYFFQEILTSCHPCGFSAFLMEHPLRIRVFCAQVHAGMWRKNGDDALLSCLWYRSVRRSEEALETDLFLLQCCAAMAPADPFVYRILERFGISNYLSLNPERSSEYEPVLVQEMLTLIIQIVKERRFCGLSKAERLKRELICKLAIGDATHSQLVKSLPRDLSKLDYLQAILDNVAAYSHPSGLNQGTYSLRWPFWKELDLYHPRWKSRDLQVAEERYLRFCNASALTNQLPHWSKIYPPLKRIARIATSKAVLQIVNAVLFYAVYSNKSTESRAPDGVLLTALHLLSLAIDVCVQQRESSDQCFVGDSIPMLAFAAEHVNEGLNCDDGEQSLLSLLVILMRLHKKDNIESFLEAGSCSISALVQGMLKKLAKIDSGCLTKLQQLAPEVVCHLSQSFSSADANGLLEASESEKRKAKARERQTAMLEKMKAEQSKFLARIDSDMDDGSKSEEACSSDIINESEECAQTVCSLCHDPNSKNPVSFLVLLQKSKLSSFVDRGPPSWEHPHQSEEHISFKMDEAADLPQSGASSGGSSVIPSSQLAQLVQSTLTEYSCHGKPRDVDALLLFLKGRFPALSSIEGPHKTSDEMERMYSHETLEEDLYSSICREIRERLNFSSVENENFSVMEWDEEMIIESECALIVNYMVALSREMVHNPIGSDNVHNVEVPVESTRAPAYDEFGPEDCDGVYMSSCGHAVHQECLDRYLSSLKDRYQRRVVFEGGHIVDLDQGEFLCPVCRLLANSVVPAYPGKFTKFLKQSIGLSHSSGLLDGLPKEINSLHIRQGLTLLQSAANAVGRVSKDFLFHKTGSTSPNFKSLSRVLSKMYFPSRHDKLLGSARVSESMLMWDLLKHSLISMEVAARCGKTCYRPKYGLDALYKELKSSTGFVMSLLLKTIQDTKSKNPLHVLQRFGGILSFSEAICSAVPMDCSNGSCHGNMPHIVKHLDMELSYPDVQFWSCACDPVLSRDPFSSLMWVLFSLPFPFLSCGDSFLYLVHIFYAVTITQGIIAYCGKHHCDASEFGDNDWLVTDICKLMGESGRGLQYFCSNCMSHSGNIKDVIRSLSFPYLRRCALLWRLLNSSLRAPFSDGDNVLDSFHSNGDVIEGIAISQVELKEVEVLENIFSIPPLDIVLKEESVRSIASKWFYHFQKAFEMQRYQSIIHCNPAVPFQLMQLPRVYQDLLHRYIKQCCLNCKSVVDDPALCLLCGRLCSSSWNSCCRENGCEAHAMTCGAGTGIFLLIRRTTILLQRSMRQAPWPSPYLDVFGEEDVDMLRGKPLYLNEERYAALTYMVASHGLDRSSKVLGQTTVAYNLERD